MFTREQRIDIYAEKTSQDLARIIVDLEDEKIEEEQADSPSPRDIAEIWVAINNINGQLKKDATAREGDMRYHIALFQSLEARVYSLEGKK